MGWIRLAAVLAAVGLAACAAARHAGRGDWEMPYPVGEPKDGEIYHVPTGLRMSFDNAMEIVSGARLVAIGETHDSLHAHRVELAVVRDLYRRFPGGVAIGMEMFREPQQEALDRWTRGELSEFEFLKACRWYENWGSDFGYYRDILAFARDNRIDVVALNPSRELQEAVRSRGLDNVPEELRARLPEIGVPDPYQRKVIEAVYGGHVPAKKFESFFTVQALWEETMARRVVEYLNSPRGRGKRIVTITGGWHARYGFGLPKKVIRRMPMPYVILLAEETSVPEDKKDRLMDVDLPEVPLWPGDFIFYGPYEDFEGKKARLGVRLEAAEGKVFVEGVSDGSPAQKAGVKKGDQIVSFDGQPVTDTSDLLILLDAKREGERGILVVRREGKEATLEVAFFPVPAKKHP